MHTGRRVQDPNQKNVVDVRTTHLKHDRSGLSRSPHRSQVYTYIDVYQKGNELDQRTTKARSAIMG